MNPVDELNFLLGIGPPRPVLPITLQKSGYTSVKSLGKGSFGQALLLFHKGKQQYYVAKHVNLTNMNTRQRRDAHNEITVLQQMHHPNIIRYVECFEEHPHLYIIMEYADGGDLFSHLQRITKLKLPYEFKNKNVLRTLRTGPLTEAQVISLFIQTMMALKYMHDRRILHRDIKSQNVFLTKNHVVKLGDFGITTILQNTVAMVSTMCGTPCYFSPELCRGEAYNNKSDIWAAGVLLYEMTSIHLPFESTTMKALMREIVSKEPRRIPPSYSDELWFLIKSMLQKDPKQRPDAAAVLRTPVLMRQIPDIITLLKNTETDNEIVDLLNSHTINTLYRQELPTGNRKQIQTKDNRQQDVHEKTNENVHDVSNNRRKSDAKNSNVVNNNNNNSNINNIQQLNIADKYVRKATNANHNVNQELQSPLLELEKKSAEIRKKENYEDNSVTNNDKTALRNVHKNVVQINMQRQRAEIKDLLARFDKVKERVSDAKKLPLNDKNIVEKADSGLNCKQHIGLNKGEKRAGREEEFKELKSQPLTPGAAAALAAQEYSIRENNVEDNKVMLRHDDVNNAAYEPNELINRASLNEELDEMIKEMSNHFSQFEFSQKQNSQHLSWKNAEKAGQVVSSNTTKPEEVIKSHAPTETNEFINDEFTDNAGNVLDIEQLQALPPQENNKKNLLFHSELALTEKECEEEEEENEHRQKKEVEIGQGVKKEDSVCQSTEYTSLEKENSATINSKSKEKNASLTNKCLTPTPELTTTALSNNLLYNTSCLCGQSQFRGLISSIYGSFVCNCAACVRLGCNAAGIEWLHLPEVEEVTNLINECGLDQEISIEKDATSAAGAGVSAATVLGTTQQERKANSKNMIEKKSKSKCDKQCINMLEKYTFTMRLEVESIDKTSDIDNVDGCACRKEFYDGEFTTFFCKRCGTSLALQHDDMPGILLAKTTLDAKSAKILEEFAHTVSNTEEDLTEPSCSSKTVNKKPSKNNKNNNITS